MLGASSAGHKTVRSKLRGGSRSSYSIGMVGAPRFELGTSCSRSKRATRLRHAPPTYLVYTMPDPRRVR